jgi:hypothetical protein
VQNIYFELTREFNALGPIAALSSGQAVVYYRTAIMSKDGDWILKETPQACKRILEVLEKKGAHYRAGAPLDIRWLSGGWSSHFEFADERSRRIRCDFFSRPPRVPGQVVEKLFSKGEAGQLLVVDIESLIRIKQTQRAKDYPVQAELARFLPPELEVELTTDPDRIMELAPRVGAASQRASIEVARAGKDRQDVVVALARELDELQQLDRKRLADYHRASEAHLDAFRHAGISRLPLSEAHRMCCDLALKHLRQKVQLTEDENGNAQ